MDAFAFHTVHEMAAEALLTVLVGVRIVQHVVRADQLVVMCREDDLTIPSGLLTPLHDFQNDGFAMLIFIVLMYLLSKIIIEKNTQSISMSKILGYTNSEISRLYIVSTLVVVAVCILISMPIVYEGLVYIFRWMLINSMSGWIPIYLGKSIYVKMFIMGVVS